MQLVTVTSGHIKSPKRPPLVHTLAIITTMIAEISLIYVSCSLEKSHQSAGENVIANEILDRKYHAKHEHAVSNQINQLTNNGERAKQPGTPALRLTELRNKCLAADRELDRCSSQLIGLGHNSEPNYPSNMQELNAVYCPKFRNAISCVKNYTECYKPFERQIINWILTSTRKMNYKRCRNEDEKIRFLKLSSSCLAPMRNPMDDCMGRYIGALDAIADYNRDQERLTEEDVQIQLSCCANRRFKQCLMSSAKQMCVSHESLKKLRRANSNTSQRVARKQLLRLIQGSMDDLSSTLDEMALTGPDFVCRRVDEHFCRLKFDGRYTNRASRHQSIVPAMLKIYANK